MSKGGGEVNEEWTGIAYLRLLSGVLRETVVVWKEGHGAGSQRKHSPNYLGHSQDGKEASTRTSLKLEEHCGGDTSVVLGGEHSIISQSV